MEKAKKFLELAEEESEPVLELAIPPHKKGVESSFYEYFALRGIRVDHFEPGLISCSFKVPPRLTGRDGKLASGAIVNLVDCVGNTVAHKNGETIKLSVDMSILYLSPAKVGDDLEIVSRLLGQKGRYCGTIVIVKNKTTGEVVAEGRHSLFGKQSSKL